MIKWFYKVGFDICGCDYTGIIEAETEEQALDEAREIAIENAQSYGFEQDEEFFGDLDQVGNNWYEDPDDEESEDVGYEQTGYLSYYVVEYDPEKHDAYIA